MKENEIIEIKGKEYICFKEITDKKTKYVYLMSNFKPVEIKFAKELNENEVEIINNLEEKQYAKKLLDSNMK